MDIINEFNGIYFDESQQLHHDYKQDCPRKGAWSCEEDSILINYISMHGEGHWNILACNSGLKRTGKSCRMRWKNYLHPNVRRGNFTTHEQIRIIELHTFFGNRWSKIAGFLPGRTDNEIKNYWRTRVQKQAKQLNYDINSKEFRDFTRNVWLPRLSEQIYDSKYSSNVGNDHVTTANPIQMDNYWTTSFESAADGCLMDFRQEEIDDEHSTCSFLTTCGELSRIYDATMR